jgi:hypothetical protein
VEFETVPGVFAICSLPAAAEALVAVMPAAGVPGSRVPGSGVSANGLPASAVPASEVPASEARGPGAGPVFLAITDREISLVCPESRVPPDALDVNRGWSLFRVAGTMDLGLVGVLAHISTRLAAAEIPIFAISTHATDHFLVKADRLPAALAALA